MSKAPSRHVVIPDADWERLKAIAKERRESAASVVREAVRRFLSHHGNSPSQNQEQ